MDAFFYWTGLITWVLIWLVLCLLVIVPLVQTISYFIAQITAVVVHRRWRNNEIKWHRLPDDFVRTFWKWLLYGPPDSVTGPYMEWYGTFNWRVLPPEQEK